MRVRPDPSNSRLVGSGTTPAPSGRSDAKLMESVLASDHTILPTSLETPVSLMHAGVSGHVPRPTPLKSDKNVSVTNVLSFDTAKISSSLTLPLPSPMKVMGSRPVDDANVEPVGAARVIEQISAGTVQAAAVVTLVDPPDTETILSDVVSLNVIESALAVWAANVKTHNRETDSREVAIRRQGACIANSEVPAKGTAASCSVILSFSS